MSATTNSLVARAKRFVAPAAAVVALLFAVVFVFDHTVAHAAGGGIVAGAPMDDNSVSSLVALDNAVEAVAARVTPAVVNVSVTSRASGDDADGRRSQLAGQGPNGPQGGMPP